MATVKRTKVIAHRGGRRWAPENTMAAFRRSLEAGVDGIELDVQRCASGEIVVFHDSDIGRTTNGVGRVADISYAELRRLSAGLWFDPQFRGEYVPLLQEVLDLLNGRLLLNIEIKNAPVEYPGIEEDVLELLQDYPYRDKIIISSFDHELLLKIHAHSPDLSLGLLADALFVDLAAYAKRLGTTFWHPCYESLRAQAVQDAHQAGIQVYAWTMNSAREWSDGLSMGLDGIITDDPAALMQFLDRVAKVTR